MRGKHRQPLIEQIAEECGEQAEDEEAREPKAGSRHLILYFCIHKLYPPRTEAADDENHRERQQQEHEGHEEQRVAPDRTKRRIAHLDDDITRERGRRRKQRRDDLRRVADEHLHGHRLADRTGHGEDNCRQDARRSGRHDDVDHGLPPRSAECEARLFERSRHGIERIRTDGKNRRHNHDGEHERGREHAKARRRAERITQVRHEQLQADIAVNDRRNRDVEVRGWTHDVLEPDRRDLREEDGTQKAQRRTDGNGEKRRRE